ncbi:MAG: DUF1963 domain-containing protein [Roseiflexaceae bacterium]|nr:DUF1963 domain-containing protein [Roseiflexaceae bacterium]
MRPAVFLRLGQSGQGEIGQSRIGGTPDLPASLAWPQYTTALKGYYAFLLQINLAELPQFAANPLPTQGMLYLFTNDEGSAADQLRFYDGGEPLQPAALPAGAQTYVDWIDDLLPYRLEFALAPDLPRWATNDYSELTEQLGTEEKLDDLGCALSQGSIGKLLGHVAGIGHDPRQDAYVVKDVNPAWLYDYEQRGKLDMANAQRWVNLIMLDTIREVDLMFGDAGYLHVLIDRDDLARHDFSRLYASIESS